MTHRMLFIFLTLMLLVGPVAAQPGFGGSLGQQTASGQGADEESRPPVEFSVQASVSRIAPGGDAVIAVILDHNNHFHTNLNEPIVPKEMGDFTPVPTAISFSEVEGVNFGSIQWPKPVSVPVDFSFTGKPIQYQVFSDRAIIYIPISIDTGAVPGERSLALKIRYQACDDKVCLPPANESLSLSLLIDPAAPAAAALSGVFEGFDPNQPTKSVKQSPDSGDSGRSGAVSTGTFFGLSLPGGGLAGLIGLALLGALGGLVLNLTPCVLPVIPIKIMTLSQHAGEQRGKAAMLGLWMALGVIAFWAALSIPLLVLDGFTDPSRIFGIWWLTTGIGLLIAVMSLGLLGLFQISLPQKVYMINPKADTPWGSFVFGIMTAILGLPCFGFVAGALVPAASTQGPVFILVLFTSMGVGMAMPYLVLSIFPQLVSKLPRTGPASELVKHIMGLLLLAAAAYFIGSGLIALVASKPYLAKLLHIWVAAFFGMGAGGWLIYKTFQISKKPVNRTVFGLIAIFIAGAGFLVATRFTSDAKEEFGLRQAALDEAAVNGGLLLTTWNDYRPELLQRALDEGKVVIQDFTAEWCINCKVLEKTVLSNAFVKSEFSKSDTIMFKVDMTGNNPQGDRALKDLGRTGIPTLAIYGPGLTTPWVANAYTADQVVDAIERARGTRGAVGLVVEP